MPVDVDATWANAPDASSEPLYDAIDLRRADSALITGRGVNLGARGGIVPHSATSLAVTINGADLITVQPGAVVLPSDAVEGSGCYRSALPAVHTETATARHATWSRIDLVVFRMLDIDVVGTHTARLARVQVIAGTPSASPAVPAKPSMSVELSRITVPPTGGGTGTVDNSFREFTAAAGGVLLVPTSARLPTACSPGMLARALDTELLWEYVGGAWSRLKPRRLRGFVEKSVPGGTNPVQFSETVTFAEAFTAAPHVTLTNIAVNAHYFSVSASAITTTGFTLNFTRNTSGTGTGRAEWSAEEY